MRILFSAILALAIGVPAHAERYEADETGIPRVREEKAPEPAPPPELTVLDELEIAARKRAWAEVVMRLPEVPPKQRDRRFERLVEEASENYLSELATEGGSGLDQIAERLLQDFPSLRKSASFVSRRNGFGLASVETCYDLNKDTTECDVRLKSLVESDAGNPGFVLQAGRLAALRSGPGAALGVLSLGMGQAGQFSLCEDPSVRATLLDGLALPDGDASRLAIEMAAGACFPSVKKGLGEALDRAPASKSHFRAHACEALKRRGAPKASCRAR